MRIIRRHRPVRLRMAALASLALVGGLVVPGTAVGASLAQSVDLKLAVATPYIRSTVVAASPQTPGSRLWLKRYNSPSNGADEPFTMGLSPDGATVFVTGPSEVSPNNNDFATVAYQASTGHQLWVRRYNGPGNANDQASSLAVSPDGATVFVTGPSQGIRSDYDFATVAYQASTGHQLWVRRYNGPGNANDLAYSLGVSPDGATVFVTGFGLGSGSSNDFATIAYQASSGTTVWVNRYNGPGNDDDEAFSLGVSPDGVTVFVTGPSPGVGSGYDYATVAYEASTGHKVWLKRYNGPGNGNDLGYSLGVSPDGAAVFVTGESTGTGTSYDYATIAYEGATGHTLWVNRYNGPGNGDDQALSMAVSPDGSAVFVAGHSLGAGTSYDYATIAYEASTGHKLWVKRYNGPGNDFDEARSLGVSPDGTKLFVTGASYGVTSDRDIATIAYDASTGATLWVRRYNGPGNGYDKGNAARVSPDGAALFVTGPSEGSGTGPDDYVTIAYSTG